MTTCSRSWRRLGAALIAATAVGLAAPPTGAQEPPDDQATSSTTVPDDLGVVHSWALAPGDGTLEAGERPNLSYQLPPGGETQDVVTLFNYSNVQLTFRVYATDAFNNDDGSFNLLPFDEAPTGVGTWFTLPLDSITVPAGTQASFPITIRVPADARPGDHAGAVLASSQALDTGPDGDTITLDRRTGSRVYVRVDGPLRPELAVEDLSTTYSPEVNPLGGNAEVHYRIVNRGNVRLAGTHRVSVSGPLGLLRTSLEAEEITELLPGESIEVTRTLDDVAATGVLFADVDLRARPVSGGDERLEPTGRRSFGLAMPLGLVALALIAVLAWYAGRAYLRHRDEGVVVDDLDEGVLVDHQPT